MKACVSLFLCWEYCGTALFDTDEVETGTDGFGGAERRVLCRVSLLSGVNGYLVWLNWKARRVGSEDEIRSARYVLKVDRYTYLVRAIPELHGQHT